MRFAADTGQTTTIVGSHEEKAIYDYAISTYFWYDTNFKSSKYQCYEQPLS